MQPTIVDRAWKIDTMCDAEPARPASELLAQRTLADHRPPHVWEPGVQSGHRLERDVVALVPVAHPGHGHDRRGAGARAQRRRWCGGGTSPGADARDSLRIGARLERQRSREL